MRKIPLFAIGLLAALSGVPAQAQLRTYTTPEELFGAAAVSPSAGLEVLVKMVNLCAGYGAPLKSSGERELQKWMERHQAYLAQNAVARRAVLALSESPKLSFDQRATLKGMLKNGVAELVDGQYETIRKAVAAPGFDEGARTVCAGYIASVADGKFDLKTLDPILAAYFDSRIAQQDAPAK